MKLSGRGIDPFVRQPDPKIASVLIYGPDGGLVRERAAQIGKTVVSELNDPFNVSELSADGVAGDPASLADALAAQSLMGGRRLVRLRDAVDRLAPTLQDVLTGLDSRDCLLLVEAGELGPRSPLRKLFEGAENAAALPCYVEEGAALARLVETHLAEAGLSATRDAVRYLAEALVGDRAMARAELDKLALYMHEPETHLTPRRIELEDARAIVGDAAAQELDDLVHAVAEARPEAVLRAHDRLVGEGMTAVAILRALQRHFDRLRSTAWMIEAGDSREGALAKLNPPVFWKLKDRFARQLDRWPARACTTAIDRLVEAEAMAKRTGMPAETLTAQTCLALAMRGR